MRKLIISIILISIGLVCLVNFDLMGETRVLNKKNVYADFNFRGLALANNKGWEVTSIDEKMKKGNDLMIGDIIKEINGRDISIMSVREFQMFRASLDPYKRSTFLIERYGIEKELKIMPLQCERMRNEIMRPYYQMLFLLSDNIKVNVAIIVGDLINTQLEGKSLEQWKIGTRNVTITSCEEMCLQSCGNEPNFKIVDRSQLENILKEIKFQASGFISEEVRIKIGKLTGATHIFYITHYCSLGNRMTRRDNQTEKLIDIETGEIIGAFVYKTETNRQYK